MAHLRRAASAARPAWPWRGGRRCHRAGSRWGSASAAAPSAHASMSRCRAIGATQASRPRHGPITTLADSRPGTAAHITWHTVGRSPFQYPTGDRHYTPFTTCYFRGKRSARPCGPGRLAYGAVPAQSRLEWVDEGGCEELADLRPRRASSSQDAVSQAHLDLGRRISRAVHPRSNSRRASGRGRGAVVRRCRPAKHRAVRLSTRPRRSLTSTLVRGSFPRVRADHAVGGCA